MSKVALDFLGHIKANNRVSKHPFNDRFYEEKGSK